jgi:hypothetical protein
MSRLALGPALTPVCWIQGSVYMGLKWQFVADHFCLVPISRMCDLSPPVSLYPQSVFRLVSKVFGSEPFKFSEIFSLTSDKVRILYMCWLLDPCYGSESIWNTVGLLRQYLSPHHFVTGSRRNPHFRHDSFTLLAHAEAINIKRP